jgi:SAM-dependent methyltransferase
MTELSLEYLKSVIKTLEDRKGWDFSSVNKKRDPIPWNYNEIIKNNIKKTSLVLDIGTGGGERFLGFSDYLQTGIGIDHNPEMLATARQNMASKSISNYTFMQMDGRRLEFKNQSFDAILCRHAPFEVNEIVRTLMPGAKFITQQVGSRNTANIRNVFGCGTYGEIPVSSAPSLNSLSEFFQENGCQIVAQEEYDVDYYFKDIRSLLFWLSAIPIPQNLNIETHWQEVVWIIQEFQAEEGIKTNEHRELLIIQAP